MTTTPPNTLTEIEDDQIPEMLDSLLKRAIVKALQDYIDGEGPLNAAILGHADRYMQQKKGSTNDPTGLMEKLKAAADRSNK